MLPWECGKTWKVPETFTVVYKGKSLTIFKDFVFDRYTVVPDLKDVVPACIHDFAYLFQKWDDGTSILREEADELLYIYMKNSTDSLTRKLAGIYYKGVRWFGGFSWRKNAQRNKNLLKKPC